MVYIVFSYGLFDYTAYLFRHVLNVCSQKCTFTQFGVNPQSVTWEILATWLLKQLLHRKKKKKRWGSQLIDSSVAYKWVHLVTTHFPLGVASVSIWLHSEQIIHDVTVVVMLSWTVLPFHYTSKSSSISSASCSAKKRENVSIEVKC
jgi:hypothetical protein